MRERFTRSIIYGIKICTHDQKGGAPSLSLSLSPRTLFSLSLLTRMRPPRGRRWCAFPRTGHPPLPSLETSDAYPYICEGGRQEEEEEGEREPVLVIHTICEGGRQEASGGERKRTRTDFQERKKRMGSITEVIEEIEHVQDGERKRDTTRLGIPSL